MEPTPARARQMGVRRSTVVALVVIAVAGCADGTAPAGGGDPLVGRSFLSESVTHDGAPRDLVEGTRISIEFTDDGRLVADAGCNTLFAEVAIGTGRLETAGVGGTEMGCDPPRHGQDQWLAEFLGGSPAWVLDGDRLTLTAGTTEMVLRDRRVADPDRPLEGTRWVVDTMITGDRASSMIAGTEETAWLVIDGGTFTGSTGCRDINGSVSVGARRLAFHGTVQTDPICPPALVDIDEVMREVVSGEVDFSIAADRLRLDHPAGVGLGLHADG